jgi:hypothetical protein
MESRLWALQLKRLFDERWREWRNTDLNPYPNHSRRFDIAARSAAKSMTEEDASFVGQAAYMHAANAFGCFRTSSPAEARYSAILAAVALPRQKVFSSSAFSARLSTLRQSSCQEGNLGIGKPGTCERANGAQAGVGDPARVRLRFEARGKAP